MLRTQRSSYESIKKNSAAAKKVCTLGTGQESREGDVGVNMNCINFQITVRNLKAMILPYRKKTVA